MYLFSLLAIPLVYMLLKVFFFSKEISGRYFFTGILWSFPATLIWFFFRSFFTPNWGNGTVFLTFFVRFWLIPLGLLTIIMVFLKTFRSLEDGKSIHRVVSFAFGYMTTFGIVQTYYSYTMPGFVFSILSPILTVFCIMLFCFLSEKIAMDGMPQALLYALVIIVTLLLSSFTIACFYMKLEWLGILLFIIISGLSGFFSIRRLLE